MKRRSIIVIMLFAAPWLRAAGAPNPPAAARVNDTVTAASWSLIIEAAIAGAHDSLASLGVRPDATPDYDPQYEVPRPPPPPGTSVQVYFPHDGGNWPSMLGNKFASDWTDPRTPSWRMVVETNAENGPITLSWDTAAIAGLPESYYLMMRDSAIDSLVDLRETDSYVFGYSGPRTFIVDAEFASSFIETGAGWNLVSLPRVVPDRSIATLFPGRSSPAYGFDEAYYTSDSLTIGTGYWLKFPSPSLTLLTGTGVDSIDIPLREGWNLVGAISGAVVPPSQPGLVTPFYEYASGYRKADSLLPGHGYWVKSAAAGALSLRPSSPMTGEFVPEAPDIGGATVTLRSADGGSTTLAILREGTAGSARRFDLPPVPPSPAFDARFLAGGWAEALPSRGDPAGGMDIVVQHGGGRVYITGERGSLSADLEIRTGPDRWEAITETSEPVALSLGPGRNILRLRLKAPAGEIRAFRLEGNYPNPFNPSTVIAYELPAPSFVTIVVSDAAGRRIFTSGTTLEEAGRREFRFEAGSVGLAAGAYFYRIEAAPVAGGAAARGSGNFIYIK